MTAFDIVIANGTIFDGTGKPGFLGWIGISDKKIVAIESGADHPTATRIIDAHNQWVMPGFIDVHTHYDVEVLENPSLNESARHGTTTVIMGNCSLSTVWISPEDAADLFSRVEALPWDSVKTGVQRHKNWSGPEEYVEYVASRPLGVNVAAFIGHSDIRVSVMGLDRAVDPEIIPTPEESRQMCTRLSQALDAGFIGLSTLRNPWSKLDGNRQPAQQLPSTYATWKEYNTLLSLLRKRDRIHQSAPNVTRRKEAIRYFLSSAGIFRKPLKTTLLTASDLRSNRKVIKQALLGAKLANTFLRGKFIWQHLPVPFTIYGDGVDLVIFEEFGSGREALNIRNALERTPLLKDQEYRQRFIKDMHNTAGSRVWHRDLDEAIIIDAPDTDLIGKSFAQIAREHSVDSPIDPSELFLDLVIEHGPKLRWRTTVSGDREKILDELITSPHIQMGFSDSGAHLRNMAFYNMPLRLIEKVANRPEFNLAAVIRRVTGELADWYGLDTGYLTVGAYADIVILNPQGFTGESAHYAEEYIPQFGLSRMVNRNDDSVTATIVGGNIVWENNKIPQGIGETITAGRFLRV